MFENLFNRNEQIKEPEENQEKNPSSVEIDPKTDMVLTKAEAQEERKKNLEDPTRFRDLR